MKAASVLCAACVISVLLFSSPVQALQCAAGSKVELEADGTLKGCGKANRSGLRGQPL